MRGNGSMIDAERLKLAIKNSMSPDFWTKINFDKLINKAEIIHDNTAIRIQGSNFYFIFDIKSYTLLEGKGEDVRATKQEEE